MSIENPLEPINPLIEGGMELIPGPMKAVGKVFSGYFKKSRTRRMEQFLDHVMGKSGATPDEVEGFFKSVEDDAHCMEAIRKLLEDMDGDKVWAYSGIFKAFMENRIEKKNRTSVLHLIVLLENQEIWDLIEFGDIMRTAKRSTGPEGNDPFHHPNVIEEGYNKVPSMVRKLMNQGFITMPIGSTGGGLIVNVPLLTLLCLILQSASGKSSPPIR